MRRQCGLRNTGVERMMSTRAGAPTALWLVACVILCTQLTACKTANTGTDTGTDTGSGTVASQDQAGTVRMSVVMTAPWSEVESALQPNFTMTGDTAASEVLPTTSTIESESLSAISGGLALGLPQSSRQSSATNTSSASNNSSTASGVTTVTSTAGNGTSTTSTTTSGPGVVPNLPTGFPAGVQSLSNPQSSGALGVDPSRRYIAANFLNEEVQTLNKETQYASQYACFTPYLVKLRLAVMPRQRKLAYSAHTFLSFLSVNDDGTIATNPDKNGPCAKEAEGLPIVVPLLVSDDVNMAQKSSTTEFARQAGIALSFMVHGVGGNVDVNALKQAINQIAENEMSSTVTLSMQSSNTLYVRIAPTNEFTDPALSGETYDLSVLLLVPNAYFTQPDGQGSKPVKMEVATTTQFRNAISGALLPSTPYATLLDEFESTMTAAGANLDAWKSKPQDQQLLDAKKLVNLVSISHYKEFVDAAKGWGIQSYFAPSLWSRFNVMLTDLSSVNIEFELAGAPILYIPKEDALVLDDGKQSATALLYNVTGTSVSGFSAYLSIPAGNQKAGKPLNIAAQTISLDPSTHVLTLTFPSPKKWSGAKIDTTTSKAGRASPSPPPAATIGNLVVQTNCKIVTQLCPTLAGEPSSTGASSVTLTARVVTASDGAETATADIKLVQGSNVVDENNEGKGVLTFKISGIPKSTPPQPPSTVAITVTGADVSSAADSSGAALTLGENGFVAKKDGAYTFSLFNLSPGSKVSVSAQEMKTAAGAANAAKYGAPAVASFAVLGLSTEVRR